MASVSNWTPADTEKAKQIWADYQREHDVSDRIGQTVGIEPHSGRLWFGDSILDVVDKRDAEGIDAPLYLVRVGFATYFRKRGRRIERSVLLHYAT
jgi:hypothetical protein